MAKPAAKEVATGALVALAGVGVVVFGRVALPRRVPDGIVLHGAIFGSLNALLAMGLVLVYRTNRIVNFAQGALGAIAANLTQALFQLHGWNYWVAGGTGVAGAVFLSALVEFGIIRRFARAPRLLLTVATIGIAQVLGAVELLVPTVLGFRPETFRKFETPLGSRFYFGDVYFRGDHILALVTVPFLVVGLQMFFRHTGFGLAARAIAEKKDRARLLGIRVRRVSLVVWALAGLLSGVSSILTASITQIPIGTLGSSTLLLRALAAAALGGMESVRTAFIASIFISVVEQQVYFATGRSGLVDALLLVVLVAALLARRRRPRLEQIDSWPAALELRPIPAELRRLPEVRYVTWALVSVAAAASIAAPFLLSPSRVYLVGVVYIYAIVGVSMVVLLGWAGQLSLGQWALSGVGAFVAGRLTVSASPPDFFLVLLIAGTAGAAVALAIGIPALRVRGVFLAVTTLGFAIAAQNYFFQLDWIVVRKLIFRPVMFGRFDLTSEEAYYWVCLAALVAALLTARNLRRSRFGRLLIASRDNERELQSMGVNLTRTRLAAFAVSGFFAATAGALYAFSQQSAMSKNYHPLASMLIFTMAAIGGVGSISGAVLGAAAVQGTRYFLPGYMQYFVTGAGLLVIMLLVPGGLGQIMYGIRDGYLRRVANRRRLLVPSLVADHREAGPEPGSRKVEPTLDVEKVPAGTAGTR